MAIAQNQAVIEPKLLIFIYEKRPFCRILRYYEILKIIYKTWRFFRARLANLFCLFY